MWREDPPLRTLSSGSGSPPAEVVLFWDARSSSTPRRRASRTSLWCVRDDSEKPRTEKVLVGTRLLVLASFSVSDCGRRAQAGLSQERLTTCRLFVMWHWWMLDSRCTHVPTHAHTYTHTYTNPFRWDYIVCCLLDLSLHLHVYPTRLDVKNNQTMGSISELLLELWHEGVSKEECRVPRGEWCLVRGARVHNGWRRRSRRGCLVPLHQRTEIKRTPWVSSHTFLEASSQRRLYFIPTRGLLENHDSLIAHSLITSSSHDLWWSRVRTISAISLLWNDVLKCADELIAHDKQ